ncbi:hypothetical protein [Lentzea terrae]|uniref:hypothetical protein n=1 Tax=Lentzea terrae TaxID=2200761 RepID=UPI000DD48432|nr:hypothetical protein [Lentzea terrae]
MTDEPGKDLAPRQPQPPAPQMDPEQFKQFQEFQRFQEYQRYQEATGQAPQPQKPQGKRWWLVVLGSRLFWRALFLLFVVIAGIWAYDHYFGRDDAGDIAQDSGGVTGPAQGLSAPAGLQGTVGMFYKHVSFADTTRACTLFLRDDTRQKFANAYGASDCAAAVKDLKTKVTSVDKYQQVMFPPDMLKTPTTTKVTIDSCALTVEGGPRLGTFVVEKVGSGWVITDWSPSTCG